MKRQVLTLIAVLTLVVAGALFAQSYQTPTTQQPPSQQVDETGQPETGPGPDVDVDTGANAEDGVMDVEVNRNTDPDTAAQGNDQTGTTGTGTTGTQGTTGTTTGTTGTTTGTTGTMGTTTGTTNLDNDADTTGTTDDDDTTTGVGTDTDDLPDTGSELPLVGLVGLLALGAAVVVRSVR